MDMQNILSLSYSSINTLVGWIYVVSDGESVVEIAFERPSCIEVPDGGDAVKQLKEYFSGERRQFDLSINLGRLSGFYEAVYKALRDVPYGRTCSYKELAEVAGSPRAARAVGQAMSRNSVPIILPCHRVIAQDGTLGGYTGGLDIKKKLLELEKRWVTTA